MPKDNRRGSRQPDYDDETYDDARSPRGNGSHMLHLAEGLIQKFSGNDDGAYAVSSWVQDIDDNGDVFDWSQTQRLLVARRSLTGTAALWLRAEKTFKTWDELKTAISKEFPDTTDAKKIHEMMSARHKRRGESCLDYLLTMKALGKRGKLPDYVAIKYIVEGIEDAEINKVMLYGVTTYADLKEKLKIYEAISTKAKPAERRNQHSGASKQAFTHRTGRVNRCFNCGETEHHSAECPQRSQGRKCFNCNQFGHLSADCRLRNSSNDKMAVKSTNFDARSRHLAESSSARTGSENDKRYIGNGSKNETKQVFLSSSDSDSFVQQEVVHRSPEHTAIGAAGDIFMGQQDGDVNKTKADNLAKSERPLKEICINGRKITALVDSGSDLNLMSCECCRELGLPINNDFRITMSGFGSSKVKSMGTSCVVLSVDCNAYSDSFHIIPDDSMPYKIILGNEFLKKVVTVMKGGSVWVNPEWLSGVNLVACVSDCLGHISNQLVKKEVMQLVHNYQPHQVREAPIQLRIILKDDIPVAQRPRRISPREQQEVEKQISEWLQEGIIRVSFSEYASPLVLVKKKDGSTRICVDYRQINRKMVRDEYPLPNIDDHIDKLASAKVFSTLDLKNGFFHLPIHEDSIKYTSFVTMTSQYEFLRAPFGLATCPKVFTRYITIIFRQLIEKGIIIVFIDDILVPAQDELEAAARLQAVLKIAAEYGLKINWSKSQLLTRRVEYLGHIIEDGAVMPSPGKTDAVMKFPEPRDVKQLHSFLGLCSYFRKFIPDYALIAQPLTDMLRKDTKFEFKDEHRAVFECLKVKLATKPVLKIFDQRAETELHTDASSVAYSAILMQKSDDCELHPVYYMSRRTSDAESKYTSYELEALAIIEGVKKFRHYLFGKPFKIVTDCKAFEMTLRKRDLAMSTRVARWILLLQDYEFTVEHRSGMKMRHADALSRAPYVAVMTRSLHDDIIRAQETDEGLRAIAEILRRGETFNDYYLQQDLLYKGLEQQLVIPEKMDIDIIKRAHANGHFAKKKTLEIISKDYYIHNIGRKVEDYIKTCIPCLLANRKEGKQEGFLKSIDKGDAPLHTLHIDHIGPLTETHKQYNHILTVMDAFTKLTWLFPTKSTSTKEVLSKLEIHRQIFGNPDRIITDRGTAFTSNDFKQHCEAEGIKHVTITTGVPRGNGQVERTHRIIISVLTKMCIEKPDLWYRHVGRVQMALNSTFQRSVNTTPFELLIGKKMKQREDVEILDLLQAEAQIAYTEDREELRRSAKQQILDVQEENKKNFDKNRKKSRKYQEGDIVAIKRTQFGTGMKLKPKYLGPYRVTRVKYHDRYDVEKVDPSTEGPSKTSSSADHMKPWPT